MWFFELPPPKGCVVRRAPETFQLPPKHVPVWMARSFRQIPAIPKLLLPLTLPARSHRHACNLTGNCPRAK
jgi:hypothetical protein